MMKNEKADKKLVRVGGSVMVGLPTKIRRQLNMGVGDKIRMWPVYNLFLCISCV
ncbi:unnamed protein product [marine sediment metagenome]|uniref:SpoVT-AbrB domain-containing protein n=1 Tax=marine sediment metagenome TaxID=412755 RepID=X1VZY2_9ZZZZ